MEEKYKKITIYIPLDEHEVVDKLEKLERDTKVSINRQVITCVKACLPDLEKHLPTKRTFKLNGVTVIV